MKKVQSFLDYAHTYYNAFLRFYASDIQLMVDSDAVYLVLPKACNRIVGYFRLAGEQDDQRRYTDNGAILVECYTLRHVVSYAVEVETIFFQNSKISILMHHILIVIGHPQQYTPIAIDKITAGGFINNNMVMKKAKSCDMNLHCLRDKEA